MPLVIILHLSVSKIVNYKSPSMLKFKKKGLSASLFSIAVYDDALPAVETEAPLIYMVIPLASSFAEYVITT